MENIVATYGLRRVSRDLLKIEQEEWAPYMGGLTKYMAVSYISSLIYNEEWVPPYNCGLVDGVMYTALLVYPLQRGLAYTPAITHGSIGPRRELDLIREESVHFTLNTRSQLQYPAHTIDSVVWQGDCFDKNLSLVAPPSLTISADMQEVVAGRAVYGTAIVRYRTLCHRYEAAVPPRTDAAENRYSAVFYANYDGGVNHHVLDAPPGAEEFEEDCAKRGGGTVTIEPPDDEPDLPEPHADRNTVYDYCTLELISDRVTGL